jgi:hypothetical protein
MKLHNDIFYAGHYVAPDDDRVHVITIKVFLDVAPCSMVDSDTFYKTVIFMLTVARTANFVLFLILELPDSSLGFL